MNNRDFVKEILLSTLNTFGEEISKSPNILESKIRNLTDRPFDMRDLASVTPGTVREQFLSFIVPAGYELIISHYGVFCDAEAAEDVEFWPAVDNKRIYEYQGTPDVQNPSRIPFKISLGMSVDLSESSLIHAPLLVKEGRKITWSLTNNGTKEQIMGVRVKGILRSITEPGA